MYTDVELEKRLINDFTYHPPKNDQLGRYVIVRDKCLELALLIASITPKSREQSLAFTHLEMVSMLSNAAIARNE